MKKLKFLLFILFTFLGISSVYAFDNTLKVYDYAQVLTSREEASLKKSIDSYISNYNMDMVLVTVKHHTKSDTKTYAEDFYDYNHFGIGETHDGIIFVIDFNFGYTDVYMSTTGQGIIMYDDYRINKIISNVASYKNDGYYSMFESFISDASNFAKAGIPSSNSNVTLDSDGNPVYKKNVSFPLVIILSLVFSTTQLVVLINKNNMIKKSTNADYYVKKGSLKINNRLDKFVTTHTTSMRINDSQSGFGGGVGGSSISTGSSGTTHGGGGARL